MSAVVFAIDPGPTESAWARFDPEPSPGRVLCSGKVENEFLPLEAAAEEGDEFVVEYIRGYGMRVGQDVFDTCVWIGRFLCRFEALSKRDGHTIDRPTVKRLVCNNHQARDKDVRQAIVDLFGGKEAAIGSKKNPGPLYGLAGDQWSALACAIAFVKREQEKTP